MHDEQRPDIRPEHWDGAPPPPAPDEPGVLACGGAKRADHGGNYLAAAGTWLAEVPRDYTLAVVERINLAIRGLEHSRDQVLIGEAENGEEPSPDRPRADSVAATARRAIEDLAQVRDFVLSATYMVASAAESAGVETEVTSEWVDAALGEVDDTELLKAAAVDEYLNNHQSTTTGTDGVL